MKTINERFREIRLSMDKNQTDFASLLGFAQSGIAMIEAGKRSISERHIKTICSICNINEQWFRTGEGEMHIQTDDTLFTKLSKEYNLSTGMQELLRAVLDLDDARREQLVDFISYFNSRLLHTVESAATVVPFQARTNDSSSSLIEKELAAYRKELEAEQKGQLVLQNLGEVKKA